MIGFPYEITKKEKKSSKLIVLQELLQSVISRQGSIGKELLATRYKINKSRSASTRSRWDKNIYCTTWLHVALGCYRKRD